MLYSECLCFFRGSAARQVLPEWMECPEKLWLMLFCCSIKSVPHQSSWRSNMWPTLSINVSGLMCALTWNQSNSHLVLVFIVLWPFVYLRCWSGGWSSGTASWQEGFRDEGDRGKGTLLRGAGGEGEIYGRRIRHEDHGQKQPVFTGQCESTLNLKHYNVGKALCYSPKNAGDYTYIT